MVYTFYSSFIPTCPNLETIRCPSVGKWINKVWYLQKMEYRSVLKINEHFPSGTVVKNLPANAGDMGSTPGPGRPRMSWSN